MVLKLHYAIASPAVRATLLTINALGLENEVELIPVDLLKREHLLPQYLKLNPLHTVPTLEDDDFILYDSHAINVYLVSKYGKNDSLYPQDLQEKAIVNQRLHFDNGVLFNWLAAIMRNIIFDGAKSVSKDLAKRVTDAYEQLETLIGDNPYLAGDHLTIADFSAISTVTSLNILVPLASNRYHKTSEWVNRMKELPYYNKANQVGVDIHSKLIKTLLGSGK